MSVHDVSATAHCFDVGLARGASACALILSLGCGSSTEGSGGAPVTSGGAAGSAGASNSSSDTGGGVTFGGTSENATGGLTAGGTGSADAGTLGGGASSAGAGGSTGGQSGSDGSGGSAAAGGASGDGEHKSPGCDKARTLQDGKHMVQSGGAPRSYALRVPSDYESSRPYRLMLGFHGATDSSANVAPSFFGLWDLAEGSTIFAAPDAVGGIWKADADTQMVQDLLEQLESDLCIDTSRVVIEGFSQGGAMTWTLACALPGTFRLAVVHSGGGLAMPKTCQPIPFLSSLGHDGSGQGMSSDFFATTNGCTVESLPTAPQGGHTCTDYKACSVAHPTRWCAYDGGHTPAPTDSGQRQSWMPQEVWNFVKQF